MSKTNLISDVFLTFCQFQTILSLSDLVYYSYTTVEKLIWPHPRSHVAVGESILQPWKMLLIMKMEPFESGVLVILTELIHAAHPHPHPDAQREILLDSGKASAINLLPLKLKLKGIKDRLNCLSILPYVISTFLTLQHHCCVTEYAVNDSLQQPPPTSHTHT